MSDPASRALAILSGCGALLTDVHVVYTSGRHGAAYVNKDAVYPHTALVSELCGLLAAAYQDDDVEVVAGPALGGVILSQWTAHHLGALAVYAERTPGGLALRRGYDSLVAGRRVLVVEDVLTTGGSLAETVDAVRSAGGEVVGAAALVNRGGVTAGGVGAPRLEGLVTLGLESWDAAACPLCRDGVAVTTAVGKGAEFLAARGR